MTVAIGSAEVARALEWVGPVKTLEEMFPDTPAHLWTDDIAPHHWIPESRAYRAVIQTWVVRTAGRTVLIDTGVGNDRERPQAPAFHHLHTDFLNGLAGIGVQAEDVDDVINTHIHYDHVGWITRLDGGKFVPTFPNATYLVPEADYDYFRPENAERMRPARTEDEKARFAGIRLVFEDSIAPIAAAGQLQTWRGEHRVDDTLRLEAAPGHTPGSSVVWLESGAGAVFVGDLVHTPLQISRPHDSCAFDIDAAQAGVSRNAVLARAAQRGTAVYPAHFAGHGALTPASRGDNLEIAHWEDFDAV